MFRLSNLKWRVVLAGLMGLICACNFPLYPQTLDIVTEPEEEIFPDSENLFEESLAPTSMPAPAESVLPPEGLIILETNRDGNREIYSMHSDGSNPVNLTNSPDEDWMIECSPDGDWILYAVVANDSVNLYLMDIWGKERMPLFVLPGQEVHGIWSDPEAIFLDVYNDTVQTTYLARRGGASWQIQEVPAGSGSDLIPKYSIFNGDTLDTRVENYGTTNLDFEIYLIEGNSEKNLTNNPGWDMLPMWSADGSKILFSSNRNGENSNLFLMDRNGNILQQLTQSDSNDLAYCWIH